MLYENKLQRPTDYWHLQYSFRNRSYSKPCCKIHLTLRNLLAQIDQVVRCIRDCIDKLCRSSIRKAPPNYTPTCPIGGIVYSSTLASLTAREPTKPGYRRVILDPRDKPRRTSITFSSALRIVLADPIQQT